MHINQQNPAIFLLLILTISTLGQISLAEQPAEKPEYTETHTHSGFLGNYDNFKVINPQTEAAVWIKPPHEDLSILKGYDSIVFSPIEVWMDPAGGYKGIDPNALKVITDHFLESLTKELAQSFTIVEKSGPGVLNIRMAITGIKKSKPDYKKAVNLIPVKLLWGVGNAAYRKATSQTVDIFEAQVEMEIRDAESGDLLIAAIDKKQSSDTRKKDTDKG